MRCHGCGSDTHLIARCPHRKGKGGKKGHKGKGFWDDVNGGWLEPKATLEARRLELKYVHDHKIYMKVPLSLC